MSRYYFLPVLLFASGVALLWLWYARSGEVSDSVPIEQVTDESSPTPVEIDEFGPLVFTPVNTDYGVVKGVLRHRFVMKNCGRSTIKLLEVRPSCSCMLTKPEVRELAPEETATVGIEVDLSRKEPGKHRFAIKVEYDAGGRRMTEATVTAVHAPDVTLAPAAVTLNVIGGGSASADVTLTDFREHPLRVTGCQSSTALISARMTTSPDRYDYGWRYTFEVSTGPLPDDVSDRDEVVTICTELPQGSWTRG